MDSENGGLSSSERQRQTAAEIARKKVLAVYSATVQNLRNLPASSRERLIKNREHHANRINQPQTQVQAQPTAQPNWLNQNQTQVAEYQRTPVYSPAAETAIYDQQPQTPPTEVETATATEQVTAYETPISADNYVQTGDPEALKDTPINQDAINAEWQKYHSAWQDYYQNYYSDYYAKAAQTYLATEKMKTERVHKTHRQHNWRHIAPLIALITIILTGLFLQYNRRIFAPIMAYVSPDTGSVATSIEAIDPTITNTVSPDPRLIIPKLNIDVPVAFGISNSEVDAAMNRGVAQFSIPGASALPGQIGNLAISGHSAGDIYSSNPYKFIFSGLERLENGDLIYINYESVRYTYQMVARDVVEPTNVAALTFATDKPMLTLITCTPLGTTRYRLLIFAEQISPAYDINNVATPEVANPDTVIDNNMPSNPPSFFESLWNGLFGN